MELENTLDALAPTHLVYEAWDNTANPAAIMDSVEYIGVANLWAQKHNRPIVAQHRGDAKQLWTDEKLRALGYYRPSMPHANDAMRHLLYFYTVGLKNNLFVIHWGHLRTTTPGE